MVAIRAMNEYLRYPHSWKQMEGLFHSTSLTTSHHAFFYTIIRLRIHILTSPCNSALGKLLKNWRWVWAAQLPSLPATQRDNRTLGQVYHNASAHPSRGGTLHRVLFTLCPSRLGLTGLLLTLSQTIASPAAPPLRHNFHQTPRTMQVVASLYILFQIDKRSYEFLNVETKSRS